MREPNKTLSGLQREYTCCTVGTETWSVTEVKQKRLKTIKKALRKTVK